MSNDTPARRKVSLSQLSVGDKFWFMGREGVVTYSNECRVAVRWSGEETSWSPSLVVSVERKEREQTQTVNEDNDFRMGGDDSAVAATSSLNIHGPRCETGAGRGDHSLFTSAPSGTNGVVLFRCTDRPSWLTERRKRIHASDSAAILKMDPWRGGLAVYADKVAEAAEEQAFRWEFARGLALERTIIDAVSDRLAVRPLAPFTIAVNERTPWLAATPDCLVDPSGVLQVKTWSGRNWKSWQQGVPLHVQIQVQIELWCCAAPAGFVAVSIGGEAPELFEVERNDHFLEAALPQLYEFWERIQRRDPPECDEFAENAEAIKLLYPDDKGGVVELGDEFTKLDEGLIEVKALIKDLENERDILENRLKMAIGEHSAARLPSGVEYTYKKQQRREYTVVAGEYRVLRRRNLKG